MNQSQRSYPKRWLLVILIFFSLLGSFGTKQSWAARKQAVWTEFKPPQEKLEERPLKEEKVKPSAKTSIRGTLGLGYETARDVLGKQSRGLSSETRLTISRRQPSGLDLSALINAKRNRLTSGEQNQLEGNLAVGTEGWRIRLGGDLSRSERIAAGVRNKSRGEKFFTDTRIRISDNFGVWVSYSSNTVSNGRNDSTFAKSQTNDFKSILRTSFGRLRADLDLGALKSDDLIGRTLTRINTVGLSCTTDVTGFLKIKFGARPKYTKTTSDDRLRNVNSDAIDYWGGLEVGSSTRLLLSALVDFNTTDYERADTSYQVKSVVQDYKIMVKPSETLTLRLSGNLSETSSESSSKIFGANLGFNPGKAGLMGRSSLEIQISRSDDPSGRPRSKNLTASCANSLNLSSDLELATNLSHSSNDTYPSGGNPQTTKIDNIGLTIRQKGGGRLRYGLSYALNRRDAEGAGLNTTSSYSGNIGYRITLAQRDIVSNLSANLTNSDLGESDMQGTEGRFSTEIPILRNINVNLGYGLKRGTRKSPGTKTTNKTAEFKAGSKISLRRLAFDFEYSLSSPSSGSKIRSVASSAAYQVSKRISLVSRFLQTGPSGQKKPPFTFNAGLKYSF